MYPEIITLHLDYDLKPSITIPQFDSSREFNIYLDSYNIPDYAEIRIYARKPSGHEIYYPCQYHDNLIIAPGTLQMFAEIGEHLAQIQIISKGTYLVSFPFFYNVIYNPLAHLEIESKDDYGLLDSLIDETRAIIASEAIRKETETQRIAAENQRTTNFNSLKSDMLELKETLTQQGATTEEQGNNANAIAEEIQQKAEDGDFSASISVGTVTSVNSDTPASVTNSGTVKDAILDFAIPKGKEGTKIIIALGNSYSYDYETWKSYEHPETYSGWGELQNTNQYRLGDIAIIKGTISDRNNIGCMLYGEVTYIAETSLEIKGICLLTNGETKIIDTIEDHTIAFTPASIRENITSTDSLKTILGKIEKWFTDLGTAAFHNVANNAGAHNAIYRGKYLGTVVTSTQYAAIETGTFEDLFIGDYWTINGINYRIAAFDYYYKTGDVPCEQHHITLVPDISMYYHVMNDTGTTTGGYHGTKMYTEGLTQAKATINAAFDPIHILNHRQYLNNSVTDGKPSSCSWYDSTIELMTEQNVYGCKIYSFAYTGTIGLNITTIDKSQFPLFALNPCMQNIQQNYWLRDVISATSFTMVLQYGQASSSNASGLWGVRPSFSIC